MRKKYYFTYLGRSALVFNSEEFQRMKKQKDMKEKARCLVSCKDIEEVRLEYIAALMGDALGILGKVHAIQIEPSSKLVAKINKGEL